MQIALQNTFVKNSLNEELSLEGDQGHFNAVFDIAWMPGHLKLISASGDHTAKLWDVSESRLVNIRDFLGHTRSVKVATFKKNDCTVFATGGRDGAIFIWDLRSSPSNDIIQKVDNKIYSAHLGAAPATPSTRRSRNRSLTPKLPSNISNSSVTGLVFQDDHSLISCGPVDGIIKVWDLRRTYTTLKKEPIAKYNLPYAGKSNSKGFTNLVADEMGTRLYANCMDSNIYCYNISTYAKEPIMTYSGLSIKSFYVKSCLSPDENYLLSGSSDDNAYIWNVNHAKPLVALTGHSIEVTCVAWSNHQNNLDGGNSCVVTCSDDACHKIWRIGPEEMDDDERRQLKGQAEMDEDYFPNLLKRRTANQSKSQLKLLDTTPRSVRKMIEQSETTPTTTLATIPESVERSSESIFSRKRSFREMNEEADGDDDDNDKKRPNIETRGRRLFSPCEPSTSTTESDFSYLDGNSSKLTTIIEELESPSNKNFQDHSPSPVKRQLTIKSPEPRLNRFSSPQLSRNPKLPQYSSPTTNLPNFKVDGEAPHLGLMSPQKKPKKENVDWLTKIRKQKLLSQNNGGIVEKSLQVTAECHESSTDKLKSIENKSDIKEKKNQKRNETILKFFTVKMPPEK